MSGDTSNAMEFVEEVVTEVQAQVSKRLMRTFGGEVSLASGVDLYAAHIGRVAAVGQMYFNDDGSLNRTPNIHGFAFEQLHVGQVKIESALTGQNISAITTDDAYKQQQKGTDLPAAVRRHAKRNHPQYDVVVTTGGRIVSLQQLKVVNNTAELLEDRYLTHRLSKLVVPKDHYQRHHAKLKDIIGKGGAEAAKARIAIRKLVASDITSIEANNPLLASTGRFASHTGLRVADNVGKGLLADTAMMVVGGAVWEIRDGYRSEESLPVVDRIRRLLSVVWAKLNEALRQRSMAEIGHVAFDVILALVKNLVKQAGELIKTIANEARNVWTAVWRYLTDEIKSFGELVAVVLKSLTAVGIGALAVAVEAKLAACFSFPLGDVLAGIVAAALAAVAIVVVNKGIDGILFGIVSAARAVEAARLRREQVEALCAEALPRMIADREALSALISRHYGNRERMFSATFSELKSALTSNDDAGFLAALKQINQAFGATLGWEDGEEFNTMMLNDEKPFVL